MASDLVDDSKLPVQFFANRTHHVVFESSDSVEQRVRRRRKEYMWEKVKHLGRGGFGSAWLEQCLTTGSQPKSRAVKEIPKQTSFSQTIDYKRELEAIAKFSQEKFDGLFVRLFGWYENENHIYIAMEYFELGDLQTYLDRPLPERETQQITHQLLEGLEELHANGYAHRDLKPANIFVVRKAPDWWVKIGDFGISKRVKDGERSLRTAVCSPGFIAPELLESGESEIQYTNKVDMWCLGVSVYSMITTTHPFKGERELREYKKNSWFPTSTLVSCGTSKECQNFIARGLMTTIAAHRLSASDALQHEWLKGLCPSDPNNQANEANERATGRTHWEPSLSPRPPEASARWSATNETEYELSVRGATPVPMAKYEGTPCPSLSAAPQAKTNSRELEHVCMILTSVYNAGHVLYGQLQYKAAETIFRQALHGREQVLGCEHKETLDAVVSLGLSLYQQDQFKEAEIAFQRVEKGRCKVLGQDHEDTLDSMEWLAKSLYRQKQYKEAEIMCRQTLKEREKLLGYEDQDTLHSMHWLGNSLYQQRQYKEAEVVYRQALQGKEKLLAWEYQSTMTYAHWLGLSVYQQQQYEEAEAMFWRALQGRKKLLGHEHNATLSSAQKLQETLTSIHCLGDSLYQQKQYKEAHAMFQRALQGREKLLGPEHQDTANSAKWAAKTSRRSRFIYLYMCTGS